MEWSRVEWGDETFGFNTFREKLIKKSLMIRKTEIDERTYVHA